MLSDARQHIYTALHELQYGDDHDATVQALRLALCHIGDAEQAIESALVELDCRAMLIDRSCETRQARGSNTSEETRWANELRSLAKKLAVVTEEHENTTRPTTTTTAPAHRGAPPA